MELLLLNFFSVCGERIVGVSEKLRVENLVLLGKAAGASAKSFGLVPVSAVKGMTVDIPLALTERLRNLPRYYGDEVRHHGQVTEWKSGAVVAGKSLVWGMAEGISDIAVSRTWVPTREGHWAQ